MSSPDSFPISAAQLTGNYCETLTFGIYLVTCCFCARTLLFTNGPEERLRKPSEIQWLMLSVAVILFIVSVFDDIIGFIHNLAAFVWYNGPGGAKEEFTNIHDWINISRTVTQVINMILGDFVLIYRCYIVFGKRWRVIVASAVLYLVGIAMAVKLVVVESVTSNSDITLISSVTTPWWLAFLAITAAQNLLTTSLLVWRIWRVEHQNVKYRANQIRLPTYQPSLSKVIRVIAESGAAYTTLVILTFVVTLCNSNALYPLSDATLQATGITFNVIIVRSSPRRDEQFTVFNNNERSFTERGQGGTKGVSSPHTLAKIDTIQHVGIQISKSVRTESDLYVEEYSLDERELKQ